MYDTHTHALGCYIATDQLAISQRAAKNAEQLQAARDRKLERKAQRRQHRASRHSKEAYTTAV
jgi:hypothetical protein